MKMGQVIGMRNIFYLYIAAALIIGVADPAQYNYEKPRIKGVGYRNSTSELEKANWFYNQGEYDEAILAYDEAIRLEPEDAAAWNNKGNALDDLGRYDEAILAYDEAIRLDPEFAVAWYNKGNALRDVGKYDEAIKAYDQAISINPQYANAWNNKGVALQALGRTSEADAAFAKAEELENAA
ncbi:MAG TPA: tetratricopeptide repeat protein [Methanothrix sp.]|nr:tetratricopeptide repeat protein [Methanothrix sp.]HPY71900.1 tetratricopeptide repeat protein [Methanothrix sp.]